MWHTVKELHRVRKKEATLFSTTTLAFLGRFLQFYTVGNRNEHSTIKRNLLT